MNLREVVDAELPYLSEAFESVQRRRIIKMKVLEPGDLGQGCQGGAEARYLQSGCVWQCRERTEIAIGAQFAVQEHTLRSVLRRKHLGIEGKTVENQPDGLLTGNAHGAC